MWKKVGQKVSQALKIFPTICSGGITIYQKIEARNLLTTLFSLSHLQVSRPCNNVLAFPCNSHEKELQDQVMGVARYPWNPSKTSYNLSFNQNSNRRKCRLCLWMHGCVHTCVCIYRCLFYYCVLKMEWGTSLITNGDWICKSGTYWWAGGL